MTVQYTNSKPHLPQIVNKKVYNEISEMDSCDLFVNAVTLDVRKNKQIIQMSSNNSKSTKAQKYSNV